MKTFALILTAAVAFPIAAQRGGAGGGAAGGAGGAAVGGVGSVQPASPIVSAPREPVAAPTSPVVPTPRNRPIGPRGPGAVNQPPVLSPPPAVGQTFQQSLLAEPVPGGTVPDPSPAVPREIPPTQVPQQPFDPRFQSVRVPNATTTPFPSAPLAVPNVVNPNFGRVAPRSFEPVRVPGRQVVVNFPPGATTVADPRAVANPPATVPPQPVVVPDLRERGTEAAVGTGGPVSGVGAAPGAEQGQFSSPPRVLPGAPAAPRVQNRQPGTGAQVVRPRQLRTD